MHGLAKQAIAMVFRDQTVLREVLLSTNTDIDVAMPSH